MNLPGLWMNQSGTLAYRLIPKCACSTIAQVMFHADHGRFYPGDIHDAHQGIVKWSHVANRDQIRTAVVDGGAFRFTCVRNPYSRLLSAFFDKICGLQRGGRRYRDGLVPMIRDRYGVETDGDFDQIASFRRFLLFVRDTIKFREPMPPDLHWAPMARHAANVVRSGGRYDFVFATEDLEAGLAHVLGRVEARHEVDLGSLPRFNAAGARGPSRAHPVADYYDDLSRHIMTEVYRRDFSLFGYPPEPGDAGPAAPLDAADLSARL